MSLPQIIDVTVPHGLEALGKGARRIRELKQFVVDVLGVPDGVAVTTEHMSGSDTGILFLVTVPSTTEPSADGSMRSVGSSVSSVLALYDGSQSQHLNGTLHYDFPLAAVGNVGGGADTLATYTFPASYFHRTDAPNRVVEILASGFFAANGNTKTLKLIVGGNSFTLNPTTTTPNGTYWRYHGILYPGPIAGVLMGYCAIDPGSTEASCHLILGTLDFDVPMTNTSTITITITGESGASASNDVMFQNLLIRAIN